VLSCFRLGCFFFSAGGTCKAGPEPKLRGSSRALKGRGLKVGAGTNLLFLAGVAPPKAEIHSFVDPRRDSSPIYLFTSAMGQQVSQDIRSRLEHCTLEELLTDDKVISFSSLGELRRLTVTVVY